MVLGIYFLFLLILIKKFIKRESIISTCLCAMVVVPSFHGIEGTNFVFLAVLTVTIVSLLNRKSVYVSKELLVYVFAYSAIVIIQFLSWMVNNPYNIGAELITSFSVIKYPILLFFLYLYEQGLDGEKDYDALVNAIGFINVVNLITCVLQKKYGIKVMPYFMRWYDYSAFHISEISHSRRYYRAYGTWDSPMSLGIYSLLALSVLLYIMLRKKNSWRIMINVFVCFVLGVLSLTKSFFLGILVVAFFELFLILAQRMKEAVVSVKTIKNGLLIMLSIIVSAFVFVFVYQWSAKGWPHLHYYLNYVLNPISAFSSRLSSAGSLAKTLEVVLENIVWGVGSIPVGGELIGDNVYIVLLHAGGMLVLVIYLMIYGGWICRCIFAKKYDLVLVVILYLLAGFSLPIGWNYKACMLPCILYLMYESETGHEENYYDCKAFGCRRS